MTRRTTVASGSIEEESLRIDYQLLIKMAGSIESLYSNNDWQEEEDE
jgi:hypothetical protein